MLLFARESFVSETGNAGVAVVPPIPLAHPRRGDAQLVDAAPGLEQTRQ